MLTVAVAIGAAAIALWVHTRFERLAPESMTTTLLHLVCSMAVFVSLPRVLWTVAGGGDAVAPKFAAVFLLLLPSMTYVWLVSIWMLRWIKPNVGVR
jgi:hypothetical protein